MTSRDAVFWLQGYLELAEPGQGLTAKQVDIIRRHLNLVFIHEIDPSMGDDKHQAKLNEAHAPEPSETTETSKPTFKPSSGPGRIPGGGMVMRC